MDPILILFRKSLDNPPHFRQLTKVHCTFANTSPGISPIYPQDFRHWRMSYWRKSYWRKSGHPFGCAFFSAVKEYVRMQGSTKPFLKILTFNCPKKIKVLLLRGWIFLRIRVCIYTKMLLDLRKGSVVLLISAYSFKYGYIAYVKLVSMEKLSTKGQKYMYTK